MLRTEEKYSQYSNETAHKYRQHRYIQKFVNSVAGGVNFDTKGGVKTFCRRHYLTGNKVSTWTPWYDVENPYVQTQNYGKKIALFGGSFAQNMAVNSSDYQFIHEGTSYNLVDYIAEKLGAVAFDDYAVGGQGMRCDDNSPFPVHLMNQLKTAQSKDIYDIYIIMGGVNDYWGDKVPLGESTGYASGSSDDEEQNISYCGGLLKAIDYIRVNAPNAKIYTITPFKGYNAEWGWNPRTKTRNAYGNTFYEFVQAQKEVAQVKGVPCLDLWAMQGFSGASASEHYISDLLHPNGNGYYKVSEKIVEFVAHGVGNEVVDVQALSTPLDDKITAEIQRAKDAEQANADAINAEKERAERMEQQLLEWMDADKQENMEADNNIRENAMQYNTLGVNVYADKAEIYGRSINTTPRTFEFPAATTEKAGVMSAEDKVTLDSIPNEIEKIKDGDTIVGQAREIHSRNGKTVTDSFLTRTTAGSGTIGDGVASLKSVGGNIVKNLVDGTFKSGWAGTTVNLDKGINHVKPTVAFGGGGYFLTPISGHKYYVSAFVFQKDKKTVIMQYGASTYYNRNIGGWQLLSHIGTDVTDIAILYKCAYDIVDFFITKPTCIDLTEMFGAGNEPDKATCDKLFGTMDALPQGLSIANPTEFKSIGFNQFNPDNVLDGKAIVDNAIESGDKKIAVIPCLPCKVGIGENNGYCIHGDFGNDIKVYLTPLNPMDVDGELYMHELTKDATTDTYVPQIKGYMLVEVPTTANLCAHFLWSEDKYKRDSYEPYFESKVELPDIPQMSEWGLAGIQSSGTPACDEIDFEKGVYVKKIGCVDLGSLHWQSQAGNFYSTSIVSLIKPPTMGNVGNAITYKLTITSATPASVRPLASNEYKIYNNGVIYINEIDYADVTTLKSSLRGVMLYYELATPEEYPLPNVDNNYISSDYGVEQFDSVVHCNTNSLYYMRSLAGETRNFLDRLYSNTAKTDAKEVADYIITNNINIETIKNDVNIVESALTEITEQVPNVYPCESGGYTTGGILADNRTRFRVSEPLLSKDVASICIDNNFVDKYGLYIWGNDDGYGHPIQNNSGSMAVTSWNNNNKYKYIFVIGGKKDGSNLDDVDLEEIKSILVVENNIVVGYEKCATADEVKNPNSLIIVDSNGGGDYTSLQEAIYNADDSSTNPKTILVLPGTYVMDTYDSSTRNYGNRRYLSIIGTDKHNCIIRNDKGYYNAVDYVDNSCIKMQGNVYLANLTIISTDDDFQAPEGVEQEEANKWNKAYCVHFDFGADSGSICEINNCVLINDHFACVGCGNKGKLIFSNCDFKLTSYNPSDKRGCVFVHDSKGFPNTEFIVKNCVLESDYYCIFVTNAYNEQMNLTFINNVAVNESGNVINTLPSNFVKTNKCYGNSDSNLNYQ